jgi:hypothetical protein
MSSHSFSFIQSNLLSSISPPSDSSVLAADILAHPLDYKIPYWADKVGYALAFINTFEGKRLRNKLLIAAGVGVVAKLLYSHYFSKNDDDSEESIGDSLMHIPGEEKENNEQEKQIIQLSSSSNSTSVSIAPSPSIDAALKSVASSSSTLKPTIRVDSVFFKRLLRILRIVIPSWYSKECAYLFILTLLLFARTAFSIYIAELLGLNAQSMVTRRWGKMWQGVKLFALITIPASGVNAGLKCKN